MTSRAAGCAGAGAELVDADQHRLLGMRARVAGEGADQVDRRRLRGLDLAPALALDAVVHAAGDVDQDDGGEPVLPVGARRRRQPALQPRGELARLAIGASTPRARASSSTSTGRRTPAPVRDDAADDEQDGADERQLDDRAATCGPWRRPVERCRRLTTVAATLLRDAVALGEPLARATRPS